MIGSDMRVVIGVDMRVFFLLSNFESALVR